MFGLLVLIGCAWLLSVDRRRAPWKLVAIGLGLQLVLALLLLKVPGAYRAVEAVALFFVRLIGFSEAGSRFVFGPLADAGAGGWGFVFAFQVLPSIIFFSALSSLLYYLGVLQWLVYAFAWVMRRTMGLSGAESLAAAANVFVGQTEAPLAVRPYIAGMSRSEILALMTGGMATIAGAVLVAYIIMLGGDSEADRLRFGSHLITASILSAPAALVMAKLMIPATGPPNQEMIIDRSFLGTNVFDAITRGATDGLKLALNIGAVLIVFTALIALVNWMLGAGLGSWTGLNAFIADRSGGAYEQVSFELLVGLLFAPLAWVVGVPSGDLLVVGQLLGEKTVINEFIAYSSLGEIRAEGGLSDRAAVIATYALCGFANFASVGIQISNLSILAPEQRPVLAALGFRALVAGTLACLMTAAIAGMVA